MNKTIKTVVKLAAAVTAVAGIAFAVVKNIDKITDWLKNLCPKCKSKPVVDESDFADAQETAAEEAPAEEAPAEEAVEEVPVEESAPIPEGEPVADESDFAE